jgi:hypothetical protein
LFSVFCGTNTMREYSYCFLRFVSPCIIVQFK